ncbi:MAG: hypothetical protein CW342_15335 [Thermoactinomycetaceae bacterium]|nr:hypothetical protein [Thermoactinomycetaceae bacterium]
MSKPALRTAKTDPLSRLGRIFPLILMCDKERMIIRRNQKGGASMLRLRLLTKKGQQPFLLNSE